MKKQNRTNARKTYKPKDFILDWKALGLKYKPIPISEIRKRSYKKKKKYAELATMIEAGLW